MDGEPAKPNTSIPQTRDELAKRKKYRTALIITLCVCVFIVGGVIAAAYYANKKPTVAKKTATPVPTPKQTLTICQLDGKGYAQNATRHPLAIVIENHPEARPQSGLTKAALVYEAISEGGITRYLAIYGPQDANEIGPIRSARLFFMDWIKEYDAFFAHAGGNEDALAQLPSYGIKDIPHNNAYYWRDSKGKRVASEHTLYSSTEKLYQYAASKGYDVNTSSFQPLKFKTDGPSNPTGQSVDINFSTVSYRVKWTYNPNDNNYARSLSGKEDKDRESGEQIKAKNLIIQKVSRTLQPHGSYGSENWVFDTVGSGEVTVVKDGKTIKGTWKKPSRDARTKFYDETGLEIEFNPGQTWYEVIPPDVNPQFI